VLVPIVIIVVLVVADVIIHGDIRFLLEVFVFVFHREPVL